MMRLSKELKRALDKVRLGKKLTMTEKKLPIPKGALEEYYAQLPKAEREIETLKGDMALQGMKAAIRESAARVGGLIHNAFNVLYIEQLQRLYEPIRSGLKEGQKKIQTRNTERNANRDARQEVIKNFLASRPELLSDKLLLFHLDGELVSHDISPVTFKVLRSDLRDLKIEPKVKLTEVR